MKQMGKRLILPASTSYRKWPLVDTTGNSMRQFHAGLRLLLAKEH